MPPDNRQTDFGFAAIPAAEKTARVGRLFSAVSPYYDLMNNILSGGAHHWWKSAAALLLNARPGMRVLDLAAGSGDMSARLQRHAGGVIAADINLQMLRAGGKKNGVVPVQCNAENLPFADGVFDRVMLAFGLRNITDKPAALREIRRVLKFGGKCGVLEFSPASHFPRAQRFYLLRALPLLGKLAADDAESYRYLGESILRFPPPAELAAMMNAAGLECGKCFRFAAGGAVLHIAQRRG